jgi:hypothetical protein
LAINLKTDMALRLTVLASALLTRTHEVSKQFSTTLLVSSS